MTKVFFVEDDSDIRNGFTEMLSMYQFEVIAMDNKADAMAFIHDFDCDIAILDVELHNDRFAGLDICHQLKDKYPYIPVLFYSGYSDDRCKIAGMELADDYITKNEDFPIVLSKIKSVLRMVEQIKKANKKQEKGEKGLSEKTGQKIGHLYIDEGSMTIRWKDHDINLTTTEFDIIRLLTKNPNMIKTRDNIIQAAIRNDFVENGVVDTHLRNIRNKFKQVDKSWKCIKNKKSRGWMWLDSDD